MNDPERLAEQMDDPVGRAALQAMRGDAASADARHKTLLALGLVSGLATSGTAASAAGKVAAHAAGKATTLALVKWAAGGAAVVALALGGSTYLAPAEEHALPLASSRTLAPSRPAPHRPEIPYHPAPSPTTEAPVLPASALPASAAPAASLSPSPRTSDPRSASTPLPVATTARPEPASQPEPPPPALPTPTAGSEAPGAPGATPAATVEAATTPAASVAASVREELAHIDQVRRLLAARDGAGAWRALDAYQTMFPRGMLGIEATMLRIEALVVSGQTSAARDLATRFIAAHPTNPLVPRVRSLVGMPSNTPATNP